MLASCCGARPAAQQPNERSPLPRRRPPAPPDTLPPSPDAPPVRGPRRVQGAGWTRREQLGPTSSEAVAQRAAARPAAKSSCMLKGVGAQAERPRSRFYCARTRSAPPRPAPHLPSHLRQSCPPRPAPPPRRRPLAPAPRAFLASPAPLSTAWRSTSSSSGSPLSCCLARRCSPSSRSCKVRRRAGTQQRAGPRRAAGSRRSRQPGASADSREGGYEGRGREAVRRGGTKRRIPTG